MTLGIGGGGPSSIQYSTVSYSGNNTTINTGAIYTCPADKYALIIPKYLTATSNSSHVLNYFRVLVTGTTYEQLKFSNSSAGSFGRALFYPGVLDGTETSGRYPSSFIYNTYVNPDTRCSACYMFANEQLSANVSFLGSASGSVTVLIMEFSVSG